MFPERSEGNEGETRRVSTENPSAEHRLFQAVRRCFFTYPSPFHCRNTCPDFDYCSSVNNFSYRLRME